MPGTRGPCTEHIERDSNSGQTAKKDDGLRAKAQRRASSWKRRGGGYGLGEDPSPESSESRQLLPHQASSQAHVVNYINNHNARFPCSRNKIFPRQCRAHRNTSFSCHPLGTGRGKYLLLFRHKELIALIVHLYSASRFPEQDFCVEEQEESAQGGPAACPRHFPCRWPNCLKLKFFHSPMACVPDGETEAESW